MLFRGQDTSTKLRNEYYLTLGPDGREVFMEIILITGANRGIGLALTKVLLANGEIVIAACRRPEEASELKQLALLHPETIDLIKCAVDREEEVVEAAAASRKRRQKLDVIVNNAGIMPENGEESILTIDLERLKQAFDANALGAVRVIRAFFPMLAQSERPRILNVSSGLGSRQLSITHMIVSFCMTE